MAHILTDDSLVLLPEDFPTLADAARRTRELPWSVAHWRICDPDGHPVRDWRHDVYLY